MSIWVFDSKTHDGRLSGTMAGVQEAAKQFPSDVVVLYPSMCCRVSRFSTCFWPGLKHFSNIHGSGRNRMGRSIPAVS
jgi:hypothetical protein